MKISFVLWRRRALVEGDLAESVAVFFERDVLRIAGDGGVVGAEEDGHEADVGSVMGGWGGGEEGVESGEGGGGVVAAEAAIDDVETAGVVIGKAGEEGVVAGLGDGVSEEEELGVELSGVGGGGPWLGKSGWGGCHIGKLFVNRWGGVEQLQDPALKVVFYATSFGLRCKPFCLLCGLSSHSDHGWPIVA